NPRGGAVDEQRRRFERNVSVDETPLDGLTIGERTPERDPLLRVGRCQFETAPRSTERTRPLLDASGAQPLLPEAEAAALLSADEMAIVDADVLQHNLPGILAGQRLEAGAQLHARGRLIEDEARNAAARAFAAVGRRHQDNKIGSVGTADEALDPVDDIVISVTNGGGAHGAWVGSGVRLPPGQA